MSKKAVAQQTPITSPLFQSGILQRQCKTCEQHRVAGGECEGCNKKRLSLQRRASSQDEISEVPPIVHEVLRSPGQPMDAATRDFMESSFRYNFSKVKVHTNSKAAQSAQAINALAYTVGRNIVFAPGQYVPTTPSGKLLLAHELTHVTQQDQVQENTELLQMGQSASSLELSAQQTARAVLAGHTSQSTVVPSLSQPMIQRQTQEDIQRESGERAEQTPLSISGDTVRQSPPGGVAIQNGTISWMLRYIGRKGGFVPGSTPPTFITAQDVQMDVTFTPTTGAGGCPTITFIQIVRPTTGGIQDTSHLLFTQDPTTGFSADVTNTETEPYYGLAQRPPNTTGQPQPGLRPDFGTATQPNPVAGTAPGRSTTSTFVDGPVRGLMFIPPGQTAVREFEVAVICVETGATFGSIRWGYTKNSRGVITLTGGQVADVQTQAASPQVEAARRAYYRGFFQYSLSGFARGSATLMPSHRTTLQSIAGLGAVQQIVLVGSNDFSGGPEANADLSLQRAQAARDYLVNQLHVDASLIQVEGHGITAREPNRAGQQVPANRRVDIHLERGIRISSAGRGAPGSAREAQRFRRQNPRETLREFVELLMDLQTLQGRIPVNLCDQMTHMMDGLQRWRTYDPTVPDVVAIYGNTIRTLRLRCQSLIPRERPDFSLPPLQPPNFIDPIESPVHQEPF